MSKENPIVRYENWAEKHPILATTAETAGFYAVKYAIGRAGNRNLNINLSNANPNVAKVVKRSLTDAAFLITVKAPVKEEVIFRAIPHAASSFLEKRRHPRIAKTVTESADLLFALAHSGLFMRNEDKSISPNFKISRRDHALPVLPYISGRQFTRTNKDRGLGHAIYGHSLNNALALTHRVLNQHSNKS
ncbi:MAG: hypothetical protein Q7T74_00925 [Candidatus Saccharibacteria bacterium]|nr:hypothetical protein [Candidatus Saccharibacteria bacterium]